LLLEFPVPAKEIPCSVRKKSLFGPKQLPDNSLLFPDNTPFLSANTLKTNNFFVGRTRKNKNEIDAQRRPWIDSYVRLHLL
jgi:hypothetical protein